VVIGQAATAANALGRRTMTETCRIRRATIGDLPAIYGLIGEAVSWLQARRDSNRWARPWPDTENGDERIRQGINEGLTWIVEDEPGMVAATVTCRERSNNTLWAEAERKQRAVYVARLIVSRERAGQGIGAALIDWAGLHGIEQWQADWIRIDVWTTNRGLYRYYQEKGFVHLRTVRLEASWEYPSAALFQKPAAAVDRAAAARFRLEQEVR
jgi:predicted N-acetyltransferase YhbS